MAFTVYLSSDEAFNHSYGDNDVYNFLASGYLEVKPKYRAEVFTYAGWVFLKADADHGAGGAKGQQRATKRAAKRAAKRVTKRVTKT